MSRKNKVNPDHYTMAGRLTPDDLARERTRQIGQPLDARRRGRRAATPPWMANEEVEPPEGVEDAGAASTADAGGSAAAPEAIDPPKPGDRARTVDMQPQGMPRRRAARKRGAPAARKRSRVAPRRKTTGQAPGTARKTSTKASGARGTPKTRKAPKARGSAARGSSPQRAGRPAAGRGRTKGKGVTRKSQKKR